MSEGRTSRRILVVEDEPLILEVVALELEEAGLSVVTASSGDEALALFEADPSIDALFTDIRMPGRIDGWSLAERARAQRPDLPVIYASGYSPQEPRKAPGSIFLPKPYRAGAVLNTLRALGVVNG